MCALHEIELAVGRRLLHDPVAEALWSKWVLDVVAMSSSSSGSGSAKRNKH